MGWKMEDIERLAKQGKITGYKVINGKEVKAKKKKKPRSPGKLFIKEQLEAAGVDYVTEWRFDKVRRFRFDWAIVALKVAIEYEGLGYSKTHHTSSDGYTSNAEKYNLAQLQGWKVYRYTYQNYKQFENDLKTIFSESRSN